MAQIIYSDEALADFDRLIEFLIQSAPETAAQALANIKSAVGVLDAHPSSGGVSTITFAS